MFDFSDQYPVSRAEVLQIVADAYGVSVDALKSKSRERRLVAIRSVYCVLAKELRFSYARIAQHVGGRDHTTMVQAHQRFPDFFRDEDYIAPKFPAAKAAVDALRQQRLALLNGPTPEPVRA